MVEAMAGFGIPEADIATVLEVDPKTLRKHYRSELDKGHIKATTKVAENLYRKATGEGREAVTAAIARMPRPVADMGEWLECYSTRTIEHDAAAPAGPYPRLPPGRTI